MELDNLIIQVVAFNLEHLANVKTLLNLAYVVFLLNTLNNLIKFIQARDVFVIDLVLTIKLTKNIITWDVLCSYYFQIWLIYIFPVSCGRYMHKTILMRLILDLNNGIDHLAFECQTNHI